jgi:hypothetical protein
MGKLRSVAEAIDTTLLNGIALGEIQDYSVEIVHDDRAIVVRYVRKLPVEQVHIEFTIQAAKELEYDCIQES